MKQGNLFLWELKTIFSVPTDVINLCGKIRIRKSRHYGGQACKQTKRFSVMTKGRDYLFAVR